MKIIVYHGGTEADLMTRDKALQKLSEHRPNNQMCLLNQEIIDKYLNYDGTEDNL